MENMIFIPNNQMDGKKVTVLTDNKGTRNS